MKFQHLFIFIIGAVSAFPGFAQDESFESSTDSKIYMKVYGAYGLLTPGSFRGVSNNDNNDVNVVKVQKRGMGGGVRAGAGFGVILNEFINIGIDGEYLSGNKIKVKVDALEGSLITTESITNYEHRVLSVIPNIVFKAISRPKYYIYNRVGVIIGVPLSITEDQTYLYKFQDPTALTGKLEERNISIVYNGEHKIKNSVGYQGVLGVQMILAEKLRGFFEITVYGISFDRVKYEDIQRESIQTDKIKGQSDQAPSTPDRSRYIKNYAKRGVTGLTDLPPIPPYRTGTPNNYLYTYTLPQAPLNMNAITMGIGFAFRF